MTFPTRPLVVIAGVVAALYTVLVSVLPWTQFAYRSAEMHVAIETAAGVMAALAAWLVFGRFARSLSSVDLATAGALALLSANGLLLGATPSVDDSAPGSFETWAPVFGGLAGALAFAAAALMPERRVTRPTRALALVLAAVAGVVLAIAAAVALSADALPIAVDPNLSPESSTRPRIVGEPVVLAAQVLSTLLFALAAVGFTRRAERTGDELMSWFALAAVLAAFARLNYFLFPSLYTEWVYTGDALRLAFFTILMVGALREIATYQRRLAAATVLEERRRMARDLHDGLAQELAYITTQSRRLGSNGDARTIAQITAAAERALDESRSAIAALTDPLDQTLDQAIARAAEEVADRHGADVELRLARELHAEPGVRDALVRITREGMTNAVRHGKASRLSVRLDDSNGGLRLEVLDNGVGFDTEAAGRSGSGFGLVSMRERTGALGGTLVISSEPGEGTRIEVLLP